MANVQRGRDQHARARPGRAADRAPAARARCCRTAWSSPMGVLLAVLMVLPVVMVIANSLSSQVVTRNGGRFVGLKNYIGVLTDPGFWPATLQHRGLLRRQRRGPPRHRADASPCCSTSRRWAAAATAVFRTILILPWLFTAAVIAVLWRLILAPNGVVNYLITSLGIVGGLGPVVRRPLAPRWRRSRS